MNVTELIDQTDARLQQHSHCDIRSSPHDVFALVVRIFGVLLLERDHKLSKLIYDCFQHHLMPTSIRSRSTPVFQPHLFCHRIHSPCCDIKSVVSFMRNHDFLCLIILAHCCFFSIRVPTLRFHVHPGRNPYDWYRHLQSNVSISKSSSSCVHFKLII